MEYARYKPRSPRPFGMGAFFDYGLAMARRVAPRSSHAKKSLAAPPPQQGAEERWDGEGGNSQTKIPRRAARYER